MKLQWRKTTPKVVQLMRFRADAEEQAAEQMVPVEQNEAYFLLNLADWPLCYGIFSCLSNFNSHCIL